MQPKPNFKCTAPTQPRAIDWHMLGRLAVIVALAVPTLALADDATGAICTLLGKVQTALTAISVGVVTIAIIFAGYQIAFAHKRITEVAPILIGGILIGAAGQIAKTLMNNWNSTTSSCNTETTSSITPDAVLAQLAHLTHSLVGYLA